MSVMYVLDAANLFVGDDDTTKGEFLAIKSLKLPALKEKTKEHTPGGGIMTINYGMRLLEALEFTFKLEGINPRTMGKFMPPGAINYTIRGNIRDLRDSANDLEMVAVVKGRMTSVEMGEFSRGEGTEHDYMISDVEAYRLMLNGQEKYRFDAFLGIAGAFVDGQPMFGNAARNLGIL